MGPRDDRIGIAGGELFPGQYHAVLRKTADHLVVAFLAEYEEAVGFPEKCGIVRIYIQSQNVDLFPLVVAGELDAGNDFDGKAAGGLYGLRDSSDGVVVGQSDGGQFFFHCESDDGGRGERAIRGVRMNVQIDEFHNYLQFEIL